MADHEEEKEVTEKVCVDYESEYERERDKRITVEQENDALRQTIYHLTDAMRIAVEQRKR